MEPYEKALEISQKNDGDLEKSYHLLLKAREQGDHRATYALATWYLYGKFLDKDLHKGMDYLKEAAQHDISDAQYDLAVSYEKGIVVERDEKISFQLYLKASLNGDKQSIYEVGRLFYHGIGVPENKFVANIFIETAESKGITH